ncbi:hypothetical protein [Sphingopyxis macrogoltabida]|nr:hypothetical protein [Sphingopyxis macrogoltabida]
MNDMLYDMGDLLLGRKSLGVAHPDYEAQFDLLAWLPAPLDIIG